MTAQEVAARWAAVRRESGLSRERFAERTGLTPGAVWRVETKGTLKPGELDKLEAAFPGGAVGAPQVIPPAAPAVPAEATLPAAEDLSEEDLELVQWVHIELPSGDLATYRPSAVVVEHDVVTLPTPPQEPSSAVPVLSPWQLTQQDGILRVSNSEVQTFKRCRRRWWLAYYRRLVPLAEPDTGVSAVGGRIHRALRWHYHADPALRVDVRDAIEAVVAADWKAICERYFAQDGASVPPAVQVAFRKESDLERTMVEGYVKWLAETGADSELQVVGSEQYLEADLPGYVGQVRLVGKLDARVRRTSDGVRLFMDHKTLGAFGPLVRVLPMNEQMLFYILLESLQEDDERCAGALYNMLRRVLRTSRANPPFYQRVEVHHNPRQLDSFLRRTVGTVTEIMALRTKLATEDAHIDVAYPTPNQDCTWQCRYVDVCPMFDDGSRVESALAAQFSPGDPSGYYVRD